MVKNMHTRTILTCLRMKDNGDGRFDREIKKIQQGNGGEP